MKNNKWGLVLEGGGAKGAYQVGVIKYLYEQGINIDIVVGTSIGSINGALIAQGDFDKLYEIWSNLKYSDLFDLSDVKFKALAKKDIDMNLIKYMTSKFTSIVKKGGIDTSRMRKFGMSCIDEDKLRSSGIDYGLVTYCLSDMKPVEIYIKDIPKGELVDYILASSRLPGFKQELFNGKYYLDGGVYNNCPINLVEAKGKKNIIVIYAGPKKKEYIGKKGTTILEIMPREPLSHILDFDKKQITRMINLGYYDAKKKIESLDGTDYYLNPNDEDFYFNILANYDKTYIKKIYKLLNLEYIDSRKIFFDTVIPALHKKIGFKNVRLYKEAICMLVEYIASVEGINKFKIYDFYELVNLIKKDKKCIKTTNRKSKILETIYTFVLGIDTSSYVYEK